LPPPDRFVAGLVLAAGGARRLGRPKQLLAFHGGTMLGHVVENARACEFDQLVVAIGGYADAIRDSVDLRGVDIALNPAYGEGCSSSIAAALGVVDPRADTLVLLLGDQPGVTPATVAALLAGAGDAPLAACAYDDGRGHPLAFGREMFGELASLHGDKGVWKLLDRYGDEVVAVPIAGRVPLDVDTAEDYAAVLAESARVP
jgi:molybdenum cofactor cytidylyltransferase